MRVAIVHDWLTGMRGGERVLEGLCELYPDADLYSLVAFPDRLSPALQARPVQTSFVQKLPFVRRRYRYYLPIFPRAIESLDLRTYDLVLSSSHCVAKGARARPGALHIAYVHTPMRYAWGMLDQYFVNGRYGTLRRGAVSAVMGPLRSWDRRSAERVDHFVANSENVARRIRDCYGREATVIYPPVDTERFRPGASREDFYLVVSALVPYKRIDLAIRAANLGRLPLVIAGEGAELTRLQRIAGPSVRFLGRIPDADLSDLYGRARAVLFPGEEDLGLVPLEAMASGCPAVAFAAGGALETVIDLDDPLRRPPTGALFGAQTPEDLLAAIHRLEGRLSDLPPGSLREHAMRFDRSVFLRNMRSFIEEKLLEGGRLGRT
jgi:glycosyltransferase involved in cell wall biosynthesis